MKYYLPFICVVLGSFISAYCQISSPDYIDYGAEGMKAYLDGNFSKSLNYYKKGFESGDSLMCAAGLGELYYTGLGGCEQSYEKSFYYHKIAAKKGWPFSSYFLGLAYYGGEGCQKDYKEARKWYKLAADTGFIPEAANNYGSMLFNGEGGPQDKETALQYWIKAAEGDVPEALYCVGLVYIYGDYMGLKLPKNISKGVDYLSKAAIAGFTPAAIKLDELKLK